MVKKLIFKIVVLCTVCATLIASDGTTPIVGTEKISGLRPLGWNVVWNTKEPDKEASQADGLQQEEPAGQSVTWSREIAQELVFNRTRPQPKLPGKPTHRRAYAISPRSRESLYKKVGIGGPDQSDQTSQTEPDNAHG